MAIKLATALVLGIAMLPAAVNAENGSATMEEVKVRHHKPASVPEPTDLVLFAAGVAGLIIGRWSSRSRRRDD